MKKCASSTCGSESNTVLKCPICLKNGVDSFFCNQECFKNGWKFHKWIHEREGVKEYNPFPNFNFTGKLRPMYPLSGSREVLKHIKKPDYAKNGIPLGEIKRNREQRFEINKQEDYDKIRKVGQISRDLLDFTARHIREGVTTDYLDEVFHRECMKRNVYPSPLNYYNFPKSICVSVNEVICHGIPDRTVLKDGDIINLDVTIYYMGFHSDLNETYYVGEKAKNDPDIVRLVETTRECLDLAIKAVKPGVPFRKLGKIIETHAKKNGLSVVRTYIGHGLGKLFHCLPDVPHYEKNKAVGIISPGMMFTIEPMLCLGSYRDVTWPDNWTAVTSDGKYSAQFEHSLLVTESSVEIITSRNEDSPGGPISI